LRRARGRVFRTTSGVIGPIRQIACRSGSPGSVALTRMPRTGSACGTPIPRRQRPAAPVPSRSRPRPGRVRSAGGPGIRPPRRRNSSARLRHLRRTADRRARSHLRLLLRHAPRRDSGRGSMWRQSHPETVCRRQGRAHPSEPAPMIRAPRVPTATAWPRRPVLVHRRASWCPGHRSRPLPRYRATLVINGSTGHGPDGRVTRRSVTC
jgi:hypothetical protein